MLANGSDLATVDNLPLEDAKALYVTLQGGLWGPYGEAYRSYSIYCSQHLQKEVAIAVAQGKKYKPTKALEFHELFPVYDDFHTLGQGKETRKATKEKSLAISALSVLPVSDAPDWIKELL